MGNDLDKPIWHYTFLGIDMGFWVGMGVVSLIVIIMNVVFWGMKSPKSN